MSGKKRNSGSTRMGFIPAFALSVALAGGLVGVIRTAAGQTSEPLYSGKQIRMVIANGAGGAYDIYARILALHLSRHIPGNPGIINQNMPLAAGMQATNWAYAVAPKDGTVILATYNSILAEPLYDNPAARYDPRKFEYIGSISKQQNVCATWHTNPVKTIAQVKTQEVIVTATGTASDSAILPRILNTVLGTRFKVVLGYSSSDSRLAVERGEADGVCGLSWSSSRSQAPNGPRNGSSTFSCKPAPSRRPICPTCRSSSTWSRAPTTRRRSNCSRSSRRWAGHS